MYSKKSGSTYFSDSVFSTMKITKSRCRSAVMHKHLKWVYEDGCNKAGKKTWR